VGRPGRGGRRSRTGLPPAAERPARAGDGLRTSSRSRRSSGSRPSWGPHRWRSPRAS